MPIYINKCRECAFYLYAKKCVAFPDGVPEDIWRGDTDHQQPVSGDHGIQFEALQQKEGAE